MDSLELELRGIRYLINNLTLQIFDLREKLEDIKPSTRPYTLPTPNNSGDDVKFDMFSMSRDRYARLCDKYGVDIVNRGCARLDSYIRDKEHIPYKHPNIALERKFIKDILFEDRQKQLEELSTDISIEDVVDKQSAICYINSIPPHLRDISNEVKELREKFELE